MKAKVIIIFLVLQIAGAGSGTFEASAGNSLNNFTGIVCCPESGALPASAGTNGPVHCDTIEYAWQEYNFSPEDWFDDFLVVGGDTLLWEQVYGWEYAWQEYNVSPEDTIWFDDFLVVGGDTLLWEQVYGWEYAWQEYNVSPEDTIWFDDFLVVGGDTLLWEQAYEGEFGWSSDGPKLRINIFGPATDWYNPGLLFRLDDLKRYYDPFHVEFLWRNRNGAFYSFESQFFVPYIGPIADWIEIAVHTRAETKRPLYTYYMPLPPLGADTSEGPVQRRRASLQIQIPLISAVRSLLFSGERE
jgi:hypothetical protein